MTTGSPTTPSTGAKPLDAAPGQELGGRYRLIEPVGSGASATVWLADDTSLRRRVAVKVLHRDLANDDAFLKRFHSEALAAAALSNPNIVAVHDWSDDDVPFLVMEYLGGGSLRSLLDAGSTLSESQTIAIGLDACRGLHYAHRRQLVHRDIKPANLLFGEDRRLRVGDFGLARALADSGLSESGDLVGTARYASPEQALGERLTDRSDVYSLGLVLIESLTGEPVFSSDTVLSTLTARIDHDVELPEVSPKLESALRAMTVQNPSERQTATQAGMALMEAAQGLPRPKPLPIVVAKPDPASIAAADVTAHARVDATQVGGTPTVGHVDDGPVRRWPWIVLTLVAVTVAGWVGWNIVEASTPSEQTVPALAGLSVVDALEALGDTWVVEEKFDRVADVAQGSVIRTEPAAGDGLIEGGTISYWVSLGPPLIRVPSDELVGRSEEQVVATLGSIGLIAGEIERANSESIAVGLVISVRSSAVELPEGGSVDIVVSLGPVTRQVPVFDTESSIDDYVALLAAIDLVASVSDRYDEQVPAGDVVMVEPAIGADIAKGDQVLVVVSLGPEPVAIPNTSGELIGDAIELLEDAGFVPVGEGNFRCPAVGTDPPAGTLLQPGNPVTVVLSDCEE